MPAFLSRFIDMGILRQENDMLQTAQQKREEEIASLTQTVEHLSQSEQELRASLRESENRLLRLSDLRISQDGERELKTATALLRMALLETCEVVRLCEYQSEDARKAIERLRDRLIAQTKADHNLLPHEVPEKLRDMPQLKDTLAKHPLLPRYDTF